MPKQVKSSNGNCDADVCYGKTSNRSPRVRCELCSISLHIKCAKVDNAVVKLLRESTGIYWLCENCRDPVQRKTPPNDATINLILQRSTSTLKLVGALLDTTQILSRLIRTFCTKPSCNAARTPANRDIENSFGHHIYDPLNFTEIFESFLGEKRQRSSSLSRPSLPQPEKLPRVDVPVDQPFAPNITIPLVPDADVAAERTIIQAAENAARLVLEQGAAALHAAEEQAASHIPGTNRAVVQQAAEQLHSSVEMTAISSATSTITCPAIDTHPLSTVSSQIIQHPQLIASSTPSNTNTSQSQILQPLLIMPQAPPLSQTTPLSQPLVMPLPPPPQTMPSSQHLVMPPPPPPTLALPTPLITQPLQIAPPVSPIQAAATNSITTSAINTAPVTASSIRFESPQPNVSKITYVPYSERFTVYNGNDIRVYGPPSLVPNKQTSSASSLNNVVTDNQTLQNNCTSHPTLNTKNYCEPHSNLTEPTATNQIPTKLLVVLPEQPALPTLVKQNWFHVSKFSPNETPENLIRFIQDKTNCDPTLIQCHKLVRKNRNSNRPLTFLSFKLSVPDSIEDLVNSAGFWPEGVFIKPFLVKPSPESTGPPSASLSQQTNRTSTRDSPRTTTPRRQIAPPPNALPPQTTYPYSRNFLIPFYQPNQLPGPHISQYIPHNSVVQRYQPPSRMPEYVVSPLAVHNNYLSQSTMV